MRLRLLDWVAWGLAVVLVAGFMLPWLKVPATAARRDPDAVVKRLAVEADRPWWSAYGAITAEEWKQATRHLGEGIPGYRLPLLYRGAAHAKERDALNAAGLLGRERQADRAWFVYAVPLMGVMAATFISFVRRRWPQLLPLLGCGLLYALGRAIIYATYPDRLALSIDIGLGLWVSLYALLGLWFLALVRVFAPDTTWV